MLRVTDARRWQIGFNPYPANMENMVRSVIMPANGRWDLTLILLTWRIW